MIALYPNAVLSKVTLRNGVMITANNHSNGVDIGTFKGRLMVMLASHPPTANAASNFTLNVYAAPNADRDIKTSAQIAFTQVTNAAPSIQYAEIDTRNLGNNVFLSTEINILGASPNAGVVVVAFGANSANG